MDFRRNSKGITLIALIVTIIVLLILAGVSLNLIAGGDGILGKAENAVNATDEAKAKEKLEIVLAGILADKYTDENYNTGNYIDEKIIENEMFVSDNVVTVDGWQFEIDRSKPKIINALGKGQESEEIEIVTDVQYNSTFSQATIKFTINYEGDLKSIQINGENQEILNELTKTVDKNGTYQIYVKDENDAYKLAKAEVAELADDMEIRTTDDLVAFRDKVNKGATFEGKTITLMNDLDLSSVCSEEKGSWTPIGNGKVVFQGTFNGNGHTISNIYISKNEGNLGLFYVNGGVIKELTVKGEIKGNGTFVAGICAKNRGKIENCVNYITVKNETTENYLTGGIAGDLYNGGSILNCKNYGDISTNYRGAGGIVGRAGVLSDTKELILIDNCINYGKITANGDWSAGGIVGYTQSNKKVCIQNCINEKDASVFVNGNDSGGIVGTIYQLNKDCPTGETIIQNCINKAKIEATVWESGGIVGGNPDKKVEIYECMNLGEIVAGYGNNGGIIGGIGGDNTKKYDTSKIERCVNKGYVHSGEIGGPAKSGGIVGCIQCWLSAEISNCYNWGNVAITGHDSTYSGLGGIVGSINRSDSNIIKNCYNKGNITIYNSSSDAGQIIGYGESNCSIENCYYLNTASGSNSFGGTSKTATEFSSLSSLLNGSEFEDVANGFPKLKWEN